MSTNRTLVLFPGALGDFLCLWPALQTLRLEAPGPITLAIKPDLFDLVGADTCRLVSIDAREVGDLFAGGPLRAATRRLFAGHARVHSFIGAGDDGFANRLSAATGGRVATHRVRGMEPGEHASRYYARCLAVKPRRHALVPDRAAVLWAEKLWRDGNLGERTLALHAGSGSPKKNWLGMGEIARRWRERPGARVVLLAGPAERDAVLHPAHDVSVREERLSHVAAVLRHAHRYLGNDSGISHLAGIVDTPGAIAFGPTDPVTWRPNGPGLKVLAARGDCRVCGPDVFCTHRLAVAEVWEALAGP